MNEAAIVVVGYKRTQELQRLLTSLSKARYDDWHPTLIISLDKSENEEEILHMLNNFQWTYGEKIVRTFNEKQGLRNHVLQCGDLSEVYGAVIVLEDDLLVSPEFYRYTMQAITFYQNDERIAGIALYSHKWNGYAHTKFEPVNNGYDTFLGCFGVSWGQCWTAKQWQEFRDWYSTSPKLEYRDDIPEEVIKWNENSWGKYFNYFTVAKGKYYVMPYIALSTCFSDPGEHTKVRGTENQVPLLQDMKRPYVFADYDNAVRYDMFFECEMLTAYLEDDMLSRGVCIDLYGKKKGYLDCKYLLTTRDLNCHIVMEYALEMKPMELNIMEGIEGSGIYLYDLSKREKRKPKTAKTKIYYEMQGLEWRKASKYVWYELSNRITERIKRQ